MAEGALVPGEQVLVRRVVLIDQELVREIEADAAERIGFAGRLRDVHRAVAVLLELEAHALKHGRVLLQRRQVFVVDDRRRHVPGRIDRDVLHRLREQRGRMRARLAGDDAGGPDLLAALHHLERVVGNVEDDIGIAQRRRAEVARQPAPALHVDHHRVDLLVALGGVERLDRPVVEDAGRLHLGAALEFAHGFGDRRVVAGVAGVLGKAELGAQLRHARIFDDDFRVLLARRGVLQRRAVGDLNHRAVALAAQLGELGLQLLVELVRRVVAVERRGGVGRGRDLGEHLVGVDRMFGIENVAADLRPVHAAALGMACIVEHAGGELQLGIGQRIGRGGAGEIWHRIVGGVEAVGGRVLQPCDDALGRRGQVAGLGPDRREIARAIKLLDRRALVLAVEMARGLGADDVPELVRDRLVGGGHVACGLHRLGGGSCGRRCSGSCRRGGRGVSLGRLGRGRLGRGGLGLRGLALRCFGRRCGGDVGRLGLDLVRRRRAVRLDGLLRDFLGRILHRGGGVELDVGCCGGWDVCRLGARDRSFDRELGGAAARLILSKGRAGGHREEGRRNRHQDTVKARTVVQTVTHCVAPLG